MAFDLRAVEWPIHSQPRGMQPRSAQGIGLLVFAVRAAYLLFIRVSSRDFKIYLESVRD